MASEEFDVLFELGLEAPKELLVRFRRFPRGVIAYWHGSKYVP